MGPVMSGKALCAAMTVFLASCAPVRRVEPAPNALFPATALNKACKGRDGWSDAAPPARIYGNTYYIGTCGITVLLITSSKGHVLIDGGPADAAPSILKNIRALGFDPHDVPIILGSHEHFDQMGGLAALKAATGAQLGTQGGASSFRNRTNGPLRSAIRPDRKHDASIDRCRDARW